MKKLKKNIYQLKKQIKKLESTWLTCQTCDKGHE